MNKLIIALLIVVMSSNVYSEDVTGDEIRRLTGRIEVLEKEVAELKLMIRGENKLESAKRCVAQQKYERAVELLADIYKLNPNGEEAAEVLYLLASCFNHLKKADKANIILKKLAKEYKGKFAEIAQQELKNNTQSSL